MKQLRYHRRLLAAGAVIASLGIASLGVGTVLAAQSSDQNPVSGLVAAIAEKFNLKEADVQAVIDEQAAAQEDQREAELLANDVSAGKLTQTQADAILAERKQIRQWAEDNDVPLHYLDQEPRGGMGMGPRGGGMMGGGQGFGGQPPMNGGQQPPGQPPQ